MKTLRRLLTMGLLISIGHTASAQDGSIPDFNSETEKTAWKESNPDHEAVRAEKQAAAKKESVKSDKKENREPFKTEDEKEAWIRENGERYEEMKGEATKPTKAHQTVNKERFGTEAEKKAWVEANPSEYEKLKGKADMQSSKGQDAGERNTERFGTEAEKEAWIKANPAEYREMGGKATATRASAPSVKKADGAVVGSQRIDTKKVVKTRVDNTSKALPADYKPATNETKTEKE